MVLNGAQETLEFEFWQDNDTITTVWAQVSDDNQRIDMVERQLVLDVSAQFLAGTSAILTKPRTFSV